MPTSLTSHHHRFRCCILDVIATASSSSSSMPNRPTYSCIRCADRKVKCDRQRPCSACVKYNLDCVFNSSQPPRKRQRQVKDQILTDRLRHYEALFQEHGIDQSKLPDTSDSEPRRRLSRNEVMIPRQLQSHNPSFVESEPSRCINKTQVVHGQGLFKLVDK